MADETSKAAAKIIVGISGHKVSSLCFQPRQDCDSEFGTLIQKDGIALCVGTFDCRWCRKVNINEDCLLWKYEGRTPIANNNYTKIWVILPIDGCESPFKKRLDSQIVRRIVGMPKGC